MTEEIRNEAAAMVDALMRRHGLNPIDSDRDWLIGAYPILRQLVSHPRIPEIRYAEFAPVYPPKVNE